MKQLFWGGAAIAWAGLACEVALFGRPEQHVAAAVALYGTMAMALGAGIAIGRGALAMMRADPADTFAATLTQIEMSREALAEPFALAEPEIAAPPPRPWRSPILWDGATWAEIDPTTGAIVATGSADEEPRSTA